MMKIRNATVADIPAMAATYIAAFKEVDPNERWTVDAAGELIGFFIRAQPDLSFVAEHGGKIVGGILGIVKPWWDGPHLVQTEIFLEPSGQRQGTGSALFHHFLTVAQTRYGASIMESITFKGLEFPSSWYIRLGFVDKDDWKVVFGDVRVLKERLAQLREIPSSR